jgi:hypothetical protein
MKTRVRIDEKVELIVGEYVLVEISLVVLVSPCALGQSYLSTIR